MDCPGHDILMATMLNGAAVMDAALLLIGECTTYCEGLLSVQMMIIVFEGFLLISTTC